MNLDAAKDVAAIATLERGGGMAEALKILAAEVARLEKEILLPGSVLKILSTALFHLSDADLQSLHEEIGKRCGTPVVDRLLKLCDLRPVPDGTHVSVLPDKYVLINATATELRLLEILSAECQRLKPPSVIAIAD